MTYKAFRPILESAIAGPSLVRFVRRKFPLQKNSIGFPVDVSDEYVLLHLLSDRIDLDGYRLLRLRDISSVEHDFHRRTFYRTALELKRQAPENPGVDIGSLTSAVTSVARTFPLLVVSRERVAPDEVTVGELRKIIGAKVSLRPMSPAAEFLDGEVRIPLASITMIEFGGEYEQTLALVAGLASDEPEIAS